MYCSPLLLLSDVPVSLKAHHRYILLLSLVIKQHSEEGFSQNYNSGSTGGYETLSSSLELTPVAAFYSLSTKSQ